MIEIGVAEVEEARGLATRVTQIVGSTVGHGYVDPETALVTAETILTVGVGEKLEETDREALALSFKALSNRIKGSNVDKPASALKGWKERLSYGAQTSPERVRLNQNVLRWRIVAPLLKSPVSEQEIYDLTEVE